MVGELSIIWDEGWEVLNELLIWFQEYWPRKEQSLHVVPMCCHHLTHTPFARENCRTANDEESFRVLSHIAEEPCEIGKIITVDKGLGARVA